MTNGPKEKDDLPHADKALALFSAIGALVVAWSKLEYDINSAIWALAATSDRDGACITAQIPTLMSRMRALISLVRENHGSNRLVKRLNSFAADADELGRVRNRIIHDRWLIDPQEGSTARLAVTADRRLVFGPEPHDVTEIASTTDKILAASGRFLALRSDIANDLTEHLKGQLPESAGKELEAVLARLNRDNDPA